jgi:hypothetical protein
MRIEETTSTVVKQLWANVKPRLQQSNYLEEAAQELVAKLHSHFQESVAIARIFLTVPYSDLPTTNKDFAKNLAEGAHAAAELKGTTPVLSLIGTHGQERDWCDRRKSKGHVGIPLISSSFVDAIPMISRLIKELGLPLEWVDSHDKGILIETIGHSAGLFFVENATEATDSQGRKIIVAQDFVSSYGVRSVFGIGGAYQGGEVVVIVVFCRDVVSRATSEHFLPLTNLFMSQTTSLVEATKIFSDT